MIARHLFHLPKNTLYCCGHSLGPMPKKTRGIVNQALNHFADYGVESWKRSAWIDLAHRCSEQIATCIGAETHEVMVCDNTTSNLYKVLHLALSLQKDRQTILTTHDNFPADLYVAGGLADVKFISIDELEQHLSKNVAVLMLSHVGYTDARQLDMTAINKKAKAYGIITVWDVSHSVGIVPLSLSNSQCDFAVGCTYKYLSGGPGSPAFVYANSHYHDRLLSPIQGWMGHAQAFAFEKQYRTKGVQTFLTGTPSILSMKGLEAALTIFNRSLIETLYERTQEISESMITALKHSPFEVSHPPKRGGHIALSHPKAKAAAHCLIEQGCIVDYRHPNRIRLCINPLYLTQKDLEKCLTLITHVAQQLPKLTQDHQPPTSVS